MSKFVLQWHLTHQCNLRCSHCYQEEYESDLSFMGLYKIYSQYINFLKVKGFKGHINFTGGEPLLCNYLFQLMGLCDDNNITYGLLTNGTLITDDVAKKLGTYKGLSFVQVSIDGLQKTHDSIRGAGNFNKAFRALKLIHKNNIETMVAFTVHKNNYKDLSKLINYCSRHYVDRFWLDRLVPIGSNIEVMLNSDEYAGVVTTLVSKKFKHMKVHTNRAIQFLHGGDCIYHCSAGDTLLDVLADGTLLPCRRLPIKVGNLMTDNLLCLYNTSKVLRDLREFSYPDECESCIVRDACKGGAKCLSYAVNGSYNVKDVNCCM